MSEQGDTVVDRLTASQRAMAALKQTDEPRTRAEIAALAGVHEATISCAHTVRTKGTPAEIAAVETGAAPVTTTARKIRARSGSRPPLVAPRKGRKYIVLRSGELVLSNLVRDGLRLEERGLRTGEVAAKLGIGRRSYTIVRDAILLSQREDLEKDEASLVARVLRGIDDTQQVAEAWKKIEPIANRIWGRRRHRIAGKRAIGGATADARFDNAITFLVNTCETAVEMVVPYLTPEQTEAAIKQLGDAETSLRKLKGRIREVL